MHMKGVSIVLSMAAVCVAGCGPLDPLVPDQNQFEPLATMAEKDEAVVRLYGFHDSIIQTIMMHSWVLVKPQGVHEFERWEIWGADTGETGHIFKNYFPLVDESDPLQFVIAEAVGAEAGPIVEFVRTASTSYPCRNRYVLLPGPNCHTYLQWVVDSTGWDVTLPYGAWGNLYPVNCE